MLESEGNPTKILVIDSDEAAFQVRQCVAKALAGLPPLELFHARDATEALAMMERLSPDVVILDDAEAEERELFMDSLSLNHPPIVLQTDDPEEIGTPAQFTIDKQVTYIPRNESLEGIHQTLLLAAAIGVKFTGKHTDAVH